LISFNTSRSRRTRGERSRTEAGKPRSRHTSSIPARKAESTLCGLVVADGDEVDWDVIQGTAEQARGVLLSLNDVAEIVHVVKAAVFAFAEVAVLMDTTCKDLSR
jgi:hypothetical protein